MLMPDKHIRFAESLLGLGAFVIDALETPKSLDTLWQALREAIESGRLPARHGFDQLVLAVDMLYSIGAVRLASNGLLEREPCGL